MKNENLTMAAAVNTFSESLKLFNNAIRDDDIKAGKSLISANPKILDPAAVYSENFLILACKLRRFRFIAEIGGIKPELACEKIQGGYTFLHLACIAGDDEMVRALVGLCFDQLYFERDHKFSMTPLQTAVVHGRVGAIVLLLSACPDSIDELTSKRQTVFHLAAENYRPDAFTVLLEGAKKLNKEHLLDEKDCHGNTVLHIAVPDKQLRIVKMCLPDLSSTTGHGFTIWVNAKNMKGETALDLYYKISDPDFETQHIGRILHEASRREEASLLSRGGYKKRSNTTSWRTLETKNVLLVVLAIFIGLAFTVTCSLPSLFPKEYLVALAVVVFELKDIVYGELPHIFYIMSFITVLLTTSTCILSVLMYSLPCGSLMLIGGFATFVLYLLLAFSVMPKFSVRAGSYRVPSYYLMLILALSFIFIGALIIQLGNFLMSRYYNHVKCVVSKMVSKIWSPSKKKLPLRSSSFKIQMVGTTILANSSTSNN
ncbi:hypothetical protein ACOSQ2_027319 [Xanthoceras sorbifolium]